MAMKTKSVTRPMMSGTAMMARPGAVSPLADQARLRSASVRGAPLSNASASRRGVTGLL
jgi:hypothetical protein